MELEIYRRLKLLPGIAVIRQLQTLGGFAADLAVVENHTLTIIECKLTRVRDAIAQAKVYLQVADYALVVMPRINISPAAGVEFKAYGIGLAFFEPDRPKPYYMQIKPRPSGRRRVYLRVFARDRRPTKTDLRIAKELGLPPYGKGGE